MRLATTAPRASRTAAMLLASVVITLTAVIAPAVVAPHGVHAAESVEIASNSRYQVQPDAGVVNVVVTTTYKNNLPDEPAAGGVRQTFLTRGYLPVPVGVADVTVTGGGQPLEFTRTPGVKGVGVDLIDFKFPNEVYFGQQAAVEMRYSIKGAEPRTENDYSRVNAAYAGFQTLAFGDPGRTTVEIELPVDFKLDETSTIAGAASETNGGTTTYRLTGDALNTADTGSGGNLLWAWVSAGNPKKLAASEAKVAGSKIQILAWPGDTKWDKFTSRSVRAGISYLQKLFKSRWPAGNISVRESGTPPLLGYSGSLDNDGNVQLGESLDRRMVLQQLSHAWVDAPRFKERWLVEGLAQHVAAVGVAELYEQEVDPPEDGAYKPPLNTWSKPDEGVAGATEVAAYAESWYTVDAILDVAGDDKIPELLQEGLRNSKRKQRLPDWQIVLNVTEPATGENATTSTEVSKILVDHVLGKPAIQQLKERNTIRESRWELVAAADDWGVPLSIDQSIDNWRFDRASRQIGWAAVSIDARDALVKKASDAELEVGTDTLMARYQNAGTELEFDQVENEAEDLSDSIDKVVTARDATEAAGGLFYSVGVWGADSPASRLEAAEEALIRGYASTADTEAQATLTAISDAPARGRRRAAIAAVAVLLIGALLTFAIVWRWRSRRRIKADLAARNEPPPPHDATDVPPPGAATNGLTLPMIDPPDPDDPTAVSDPSDAETEPSDSRPPAPVVQQYPPDMRPEPPSVRSFPPSARPPSLADEPPAPAIQPHPPGMGPQPVAPAFGEGDAQNGAAQAGDTGSPPKPTGDASTDDTGLDRERLNGDSIVDWPTRRR